MKRTANMWRYFILLLIAIYLSHSSFAGASHENESVEHRTIVKSEHTLPSSSFSITSYGLSELVYSN